MEKKGDTKMERIDEYKPNVLKSEVPVFLDPMEELFDKHRVFVFGYGSLLYPHGWRPRGMIHVVTQSDIKECILKGFERGPWGIYNNQNYYGVIRNKDKYLNGVVVEIRTLHDWVGLMKTEMIAGLYDWATYRVVDVTENIEGVTLPKNARVHCVCARPNAKSQLFHSIPASWYYSEVWQEVVMERTSEFQEEFLKTGGFRNGNEVWELIDNKEGKEDV